MSEEDKENVKTKGQKMSKRDELVHQAGSLAFNQISKGKQYKGHTPDPWTWGKPQHYALSGQFGQVVCWEAGERGEQWRATDPEIEGNNQRLLAAAPRLLFALRMLLEDNLDYIRVNHLAGAENNHAIREAQAAINLAEWGT